LGYEIGTTIKAIKGNHPLPASTDIKPAEIHTNEIRPNMWFRKKWSGEMILGLCCKMKRPFERHHGWGL
jgi:hypothetical protein